MPGRRIETRDLNLAELAAQSIMELPDRAALSLIDPSLTNSAFTYAGAAQNAPIEQGTMAGSGVASQSTTSATSAAQNAATAENAATAQNVNSPGSLATASQFQYAPSSSTSP
jgi:hypothetical protein